MLFHPEHIPDDFDRAKMKASLISCKHMLRKRNFIISMDEFSASTCIKLNRGSVGCVTIRNRNPLHRKNIRELIRVIKLLCNALEENNILAKLP